MQSLSNGERMPSSALVRIGDAEPFASLPDCACMVSCSLVTRENIEPHKRLPECTAKPSSILATNESAEPLQRLSDCAHMQAHAAQLCCIDSEGDIGLKMVWMAHQARCN